MYYSVMRYSTQIHKIIDHNFWNIHDFMHVKRILDINVEEIFPILMQRVENTEIKLHQ